MTLTPLQKIYLGTYTASSIAAPFPDKETSIRWVMETAPKRKPLGLTPEDVIKVTS